MDASQTFEACFKLLDVYLQPSVNPWEWLMALLARSISNASQALVARGCAKETSHEMKECFSPRQTLQYFLSIPTAICAPSTSTTGMERTVLPLINWHYLRRILWNSALLPTRRSTALPMSMNTRFPTQRRASDPKTRFIATTASSLAMSTNSSFQMMRTKLSLSTLKTQIKCSISFSTRLSLYWEITMTIKLPWAPYIWNTLNRFRDTSTAQE